MEFFFLYIILFHQLPIHVIRTILLFALYVALYFISIISLIPVSIMMIFGSLTYGHIRQTRVLAEQRADR